MTVREETVSVTAVEASEARPAVDRGMCVPGGRRTDVGELLETGKHIIQR